MIEHEIRFRVPSEAAGPVRDEFLRVSGQDATMPLRALYFDTPGRDLAALGIGLRLRREGSDWVQTIKTAALDGVSRYEHNLPREDATLALAAFAGRPGLEEIGDADALRALQETLITVFETDIERRRIVVRTTGRAGAGVVEIAFDQGALIADGRRADVCELEFELLSGDLAAIWQVAEPWIRRFALTALPAGKAQRGHRLRAGSATPAERARAVSASPGQSPGEAYARLFDDCYRQIAGNAAVLLTEEADDSHVHQMRVGIRRLRALVRLFDGWIEAPPAQAVNALTEAFRVLGASRDRDVYRQEFVPMIEAAGGVAPDPALVFDGTAPAPGPICADPAFQCALVELQRHRHQVVVATSGASLEPLVRGRLRDWTRRVARAARRFDSLDDESRHDLRKRIKRLRYGFEFCAPLLPRSWRGLTGRLAKAQEALGSWCDLHGARTRLGAVRADGFALGWTVARLEAAEVPLSTRMRRLATRIRKVLGR